jgi:transcription termination factor NusB
MSVLSLDSLIDSINRKDESDQMTKQASAVDATTELEQALSINAGEDNTMTKSAHEQAGLAIADAILSGLQKQAENNVIAETATMKSQDDAKIKDTPVAGKTVSEVAKDLLARAGAEGKTHVPEHPAQVVAAEGGAQTEGRAPIDSQLDKQASECLAALINDGVAFDEAVELVKEASVQMQADLEKAAAVNHLIDNGIDFAEAVELVKQASLQSGAAEGEYSELEKAAAVNELVAEGYSFDDALAAINAVIAGE